MPCRLPAAGHTPIDLAVRECDGPTGGTAQETPANCGGQMPCGLAEKGKAGQEAVRYQERRFNRISAPAGTGLSVRAWQVTSLAQQDSEMQKIVFLQNRKHVSPHALCHDLLFPADDIGIDGRGGDVGVPEPFLDERQRDAGEHRVDPERMTQPFGGRCRNRKSGLAHHGLDHHPGPSPAPRPKEG